MKPASLVGGIAVALVALVFCSGRPLIAQTHSDEITQLRQENAELETKVKELETLLTACMEEKKVRFSAEHGWQNKRNWRNLETGMMEEQVRMILGEPVKEIQGVRTLWYYPSIYSGYVAFDDKGRLSGWKEP
jgi:hypothetical protein